MPRRVIPHLDETKAAVIAALLTGQSVHQAAEAGGVSRRTVQRWRDAFHMADLAPQKREKIERLLDTLLRAYLTTLIAQAKFFADPAWIRRQGAAQLAILHGVLADKTFRFLEALVDDRVA